jgi:uncharacterized MnhB-related membrane protein
MSEYEIHQLVIETRWEFAVPTLTIIFVSMGYMAVGIWRAGGLDRLSVRLLQLSYIALVALLAIRGYAAVIRAIKLTAVLMQTIPHVQFNYMYPAIQHPTVAIRLATLVILLVVTLFLLNRAIERDA